MTSHFYSILLKHSVEEVSQWIRNCNIDVLSMKIIMLPINIDQHWSLCSIYLTSDFCSFHRNFSDADTSDAPFILHLDSYNLNNSEQIAHSIWQWLDVEWNLSFLITLHWSMNLACLWCCLYKVIIFVSYFLYHLLNYSW
jgi:Ulp1 family protease